MILCDECNQTRVRKVVRVRFQGKVLRLCARCREALTKRRQLSLDAWMARYPKRKLKPIVNSDMSRWRDTPKKSQKKRAKPKPKPKAKSKRRVRR